MLAQLLQQSLRVPHARQLAPRVYGPVRARQLAPRVQPRARRDIFYELRPRRVADL
jgi:hypothetical protein